MLEDRVFPLEDMESVFQDFKAAPYRQVGCAEFMPNLSAIDALMNVGGPGAGRLARGGTKHWLGWDEMPARAEKPPHGD